MYKQIVEPESRETNINLSYDGKVIYIYTNKSPVMNRLVKRFPKADIQEHTFGGEVIAITMTLPWNEMKTIMSSTLFKTS